MSAADFERIAREARIAQATTWPPGDSWIRGYAEDVPALLAENERLRAQDKTQLQEILRLCRENERLREALKAISRDRLWGEKFSLWTDKEIARNALAAVPEERP